MELSIVIPVYNEEENVEPLIGEVEGVLAAAGKTYEIIAVDDGSKDHTFMAITEGLRRTAAWYRDMTG